MSLFPLRPLAAAVALSLSPGLFAAEPPGAPASAAVQAYAIPAGPLGDTLSRIAREGRRNIAADPALLRGRVAPAVQGRYSPEEAARRALDGSGLELVVTPGGELSVRQAAAPVSTAPPAAELAPVAVAGAAMPGPYVADLPSSVAAKVDLPPRLTPFTVNQVTEEVIRERGDTSIFESFERFAGVTTASDNGDIGQGMSRSISVRGFSVSGAGQLLINGQRSYGSASAARGSDSLEAIELLRGPAALYYGAAEPGGIINYSYKRPRAEAQYVVLGRTDSKGSYGGMVDMAGPLDKEGVWRYRAVGSYQHTRDDQEHVWSEPKSALAALSFVPNARFDTTLTYERLKIDSVPEQENNMRITRAGSPYYGQFYPVPRDFFWGSLNDRASRDTDTLLWDMSWRPSEAFRVKANFNYQHYTQWWQNTRVNSAGNGPDAAGNVSRYVSGRQSDGNSYSGGLDFSGTVPTGPLRHDWLVGVGFGHTESRSSGRAVAAETRPGQPYDVGPLNIFDPDYRDWPYRDRIWADPLGLPTQRDDRNLYFQDLVHLPDGRTRLMMAMGWSQIYSRPGGGEASKVDKWSPRVAVMRDVTATGTVYASYGESFSPNALNLLDMSGNYITTPQEGRQFEVGYKQDLFGGRAMLTTALFRIDKKNMPMPAQEDGQCDELAAPAPGTPGSYDGSGDCRVSINGLQRSQGIELELTGALTDWWSAQLAYAYLDTEYVRTDDPWAAGRSMAFMPRHSLSLWNKFRLHQSDAYGRFDMGLGLRAWSKSHNAWRSAAAHMRGTDTDWNPGYGIVDLAFFWEKRLAGGKNLKLSMNINNLFDKTYYDRNRFAAGNTIVWGNERRVLFAARLAF
ncbi:TonB-dependent receptor [Pigmentiphaga soli]|uniref:TonB-dependent receptor n=1 Tax=Pigmentiphaga soli TaxID=1007095 RepID=A0ABP8GFZ0_9BURK